MTGWSLFSERSVLVLCKKSIALTLAATMMLPLTVIANPTGEQVVTGSASFNRSHNRLDINQGTNSAIINWQDFSIGAGETTKFIQPSATSAVLNRVVSGNPSQIYGNLTANGQVYLVNQNGILVGPSGMVDTKGFVASTLDVANEAFLAGGDLTFFGDSGANLINLGMINAVEGDVLLIAHSVQNAGTITAKEGTVALAAGSEVLVCASGEKRIYIRAGASDGKVENSGLIDSVSAELKALGGNEFALAVNNTGLVRATALEERGGRIWLVSATGTTENSGTLTAKRGDKGGEVQVLGDRVALTGSSLIDVSGDSGGGTALVGGDYQGKNSAVKNAVKTYVGKKTLIRADAGYNGHGGKVIVWADEGTQFAGTISARGGAEGGDGGFAEVSGKKVLAYQGTTDLRAPAGETGTLLLDPYSITIQERGDFPTPPFEPTKDKSIIGVDVLQGALASGNVTISTHGDGLGTQDGDITVLAPIEWSSGSDLVMEAANDIFINADISSLGSGTVTIKGASIAINNSIRTKGGNLNLTASIGTVTMADGASLTTTAEENSLTSSGSVTVTAETAISLQDIITTGASNAPFSSSAGGSIMIAGRSISLHGNLAATSASGTGGSVDLNGLVVLTADCSVTTNAAAVNFTSSIDSDGTPHSLAIEAGGGTVVFKGAIGQMAPLASLTVTSASQVDIEKNVTTNSTGGLSVTSSTIRLGDDDDLPPGSDAMTINTLVSAGPVSLNASNIYLDDAVTFVRGSGAIIFTGNLTSQAGKHHHLTFIGTGGGAITVTGEIGAIDHRLGNILVNSVTDLTFSGQVFAGSLVSLNGTGQVNIGGVQGYDDANGLQLETSGTANAFADDENIIIHSDVTLSNPAAPLSISTPMGNIDIVDNAKLTTEGGSISLSAGGEALTLGEATELNSKGGAINLSAGGGVLTLGELTKLNSTGGAISLSAGGGALTLKNATELNSKGGGISLSAEGGALTLGGTAKLESTSGLISLTGKGVLQSANSVIKTHAGSIYIDGGASPITLAGLVQSTDAGEIKIVNATDVILNFIGTFGTVILGEVGKELTGTVSQPAGGIIYASTLMGDAHEVTIMNSMIGNLGAFKATGAMTLQDNKGPSTAAGLKLTGNVTVGAASTIETRDGLLDLGAFSLNAAGFGLSLTGVGVSQGDGSAILASTADINGGSGDISLFSAFNDFTGQVRVNSSGSQVSIRDANQLSMKTLGKLAATTSIKAWAGTTLLLTLEDIATTSGNIEFCSLNGDLSTPGKLATGSGSVLVSAKNQVTLSRSIISTSGDLKVDAATITQSSGSSVEPLLLKTGSAGTITVTATDGIVMGQYCSYLSDTGTIAIKTGGSADLADITSNGTLTVNAVGSVQQTGAGILHAAQLSITAKDVELKNANEVDTLAADLSGNLAFVNNQTLTVGSVDSTVGISAKASVLLRTTDGDLFLEQTVTGGSDIVLVSAENFTNNVDKDALSVGVGNSWQVWSKTPTLPGALKGLVPNFKQYNATYGTTSVATGATGNGLLYTLAPKLTVALQGAVERSYNGGVDATLAQDNYLIAGSLTGDSVVLSTAGKFENKHVDDNKKITVNVTIDSASQGGILVYGYQLATGSELIEAKIGKIIPVNLTITTDAVSKTYDGSFNASGQAAVASGTLFDTDSISGGTFAFTNANAGIGNKVVTVSDVTVTDGNGGSNYLVNYAKNSTSTINKASLTISSSDVTKTYDGNVTAAGSAKVTAGTLYNNVSNKGVLDSISGGSFEFTDANAGIGNKAVSVDVVTVNDGNSGNNYAVIYAKNSTSTINKASLTISSSDVTKTYDGNVTAAGSAKVTAGTLYNNVSNKGVLDSISGGSFEFTDANAGIGNKAVSVDVVTVNDGNSGNNYAVIYAKNSTSTINKASLTISSSDVTKTYDGNVTAAGSAKVTAGTLYNNVSNKGVLDSISGGSFEFTDANAGIGNKAVSVDVVTVNDGNSGNNYAVIYAKNSTSTINKASLTISSSDVTKTYDGNVKAAGSAKVTAGTLYNNVSNKGVLDSISGGSFEFTDANAGIGNKAVNVDVVTVNDGNSGNNYAVIYAKNSTSTINKASLTISSSDVTKTYDGNVKAAGSAKVTAGTLYNNVSNKGVLDSISGGSFEFTDANAGIGNKAVNVDVVTVNDGNSGNNYAVIYANNSTSTINKASLTISSSDVTKTYDGNVKAAGSAKVTAGTLYNNVSNKGVLDSISGGSFEFTDANAGIGNKAVNVDVVTVNDGNSGNNYAVIYAKNSTSTINKASLTISSSDVTKTYDGNVTAAGSAKVTAGTLYNNVSNKGVLDSISGGSFEFTDANAGIGNKAVNVDVVTVNDGNSGNNYAVIYANNSTSTINKASLTISSSDVTKTYDGNVKAAGSAKVTAGTLYNNVSNKGVLDSISGGSFEFTDANAGIGNKAVNVDVVTVNDGNSGNNYAVIYAKNSTSTINKASLTISSSDVTKTYDGNVTAAGSAKVTAGTLYNNVSNKGVLDSISGGSFEFTDANAGIGNKAVNVDVVTVNDGNSGNNYAVIYANNSTSTINKASLTISSSDVTKTYDGNVTAAGSAKVTAGTLYNNVSNKGVLDSISGGSFEFTDANAGIGNKAVNVDVVTVNDGNSGNNYAVIYAKNSTSTINKASLTISSSDVTKTYDGNVTAAGSAKVTAGTLYNNVSNKGVLDSISGGSFEFTDANAGIGNKAVSVDVVTVNDGNSGNNYAVIYAKNSTSTINKASLTISSSDVTKTYDGNVTAAGSAKVTAGTLYNNVSNKGVLDSISGGSFEFTDANAGIGNKAVSVDVVTVNDGNSGNNYAVIYAKNSTSTINKASLTISSSDVTKTYDGNVKAAGSAKVTAGTLYNNVSNKGVLDSISGGSFEFTDANAGIGNKAVNVDVVTVNDGNSGNNYAVIYANNSTSTINKASLTISSSDVTKTYDGNVTAAGSAKVTAGTLYNNVSNKGVLDSISGGSFEFTDANAGIGNKAVNVDVVTVNDGNSGNNYAVIYAKNSTSTINKASLTISSSDVTKTYDGNVTAAGSAKVTAGTLYNNVSNKGVLDSISGGSFEFTDANAGIGNKAVSVDVVTVNDGNSGNNYAVIYAKNSTSTINKASLTISSSDVTKTYDGNVTAAGSAKVTAGTLYNNVSNKGVLDSISGGSFEFTDANAGIGNKAVNVDVVTVNDGNSGNNYAVTYANNTSSTINPYEVHLTGSRDYDGTAVVASDIFNTGSLVGSETLTLSGSGTMASKNVVTNGTVSLGTLALVDDTGLASNYILTGGTQTATITPASLTLSGITAKNKVYNADKTATVNTGSANYTGLFAGDLVSVNASGLFSDKNVANGKTVTLASSYSGADIGNYRITNQATTMASITARRVLLTVDGAMKVYGDADPLFTSVAELQQGDRGLMGGDSLSATLIRRAGENVGSYSIGLGTLANNNYAITYLAADLTISPATLTYVADAVNRNYGDANPLFTGKVIGFKNSETLASATVGDAIYSTDATIKSKIGTYAIYGSGLTGLNGNYVFVQDVNNVSALSVLSAATPESSFTSIINEKEIGDLSDTLTMSKDNFMCCQPLFSIEIEGHADRDAGNEIAELFSSEIQFEEDLTGFGRYSLGEEGDGQQSVRNYLH
ncbi:YDG domain-containing protein [Desulfotalea psychrophila]|nr:YDG domain-containing protein [Desulfotalea psychrophila]